MKKAYLTILAVLGLGLAVSCSTSSPIPALISTGSIHHEDRNTGNKIGPGNISKRGESCSVGIALFNINVIYFGAGASITEAMTSAGITKVGVIDNSSFNILGPLFYQDCVVVWGE